MRQTTGGHDYAALMRLRLGFDPAQAVEAGIRRGWVSRPTPPPRCPRSELYKRPDCLTGYNEAAQFLGTWPSVIAKLVRRGTLHPIRPNRVCALFPLEELVQVKAARSATRSTAHTP